VQGSTMTAPSGTTDQAACDVEDGSVRTA
jgi:hypothetical protein